MPESVDVNIYIYICTVRSRFTTVRFTTIHFYDIYIRDGWCGGMNWLRLGCGFKSLSELVSEKVKDLPREGCRTLIWNVVCVCVRTQCNHVTRNKVLELLPNRSYRP